MRYLLALPLAILLSTAACDQTPQNPEKPTPEPSKVFLDRYELHDIYNGNFHGTALLDKQTGRIWTMGTTTNGKGQIDSVDFSSALVIPSP